jgi:xylulokinase
VEVRHIPPSELVIGVDVGTSSAKTVLVNPQGDLLAWSRIEYPMHRPHPGWAENDPEDWVRAVKDGIHQVLQQSAVDPGRVISLCIVTVRDHIVLLDEHDNVLAPSISWIDRRDLDECEQIYNDFGRHRLNEITGLVPEPALTLPNIYWIRRHTPDVWNKTKRILGCKDYILYRLTGKIATDISSPTRHVLYDLRKKEWSEWICNKADIDIGLLPPIVYKPWEVWDKLSPAAAESLGLKPGTILAAGGGDDPAAVLGGGAYEPGDILLGTGTGSTWRTVSDRNAVDDTLQADLSHHVVPDLYIYELVITGTGTSFRWFKDTFGALGDPERNPYERLLEEASHAPAGSDGLIFYPYLEGARAPRFNDKATGTWFGIKAGHTRSHCVRAIVEGIAYQCAPMLKLVERYSGKIPDTLIIVDDEARSAFWNQMKADITGRVVCTPRVLHGAAMGAAVLASQACGLFSNAKEAVNSMIKIGSRFEPNPVNQAIYRQAQERYERLYQYMDNAYTAS